MDGLRNGSTPIPTSDSKADTGNMSSTLSGALKNLLQTMTDKKPESDATATDNNTTGAGTDLPQDQRDVLEGLMVENAHIQSENQKQKWKIEVWMCVYFVSAPAMWCTTLVPPRSNSPLLAIV